MKKLLFLCFHIFVVKAQDVADLNTPSAFPTDYDLIWTEAYQAKLTWKRIDDDSIRGYNVCVCSLIDGCFPYSKLINASTQESEPVVVVSGLKPNYLYMVKYAAFNEKGMGPWSSLEWKSMDPGIFMFNTAKAPPNVAPKKVKIMVISKTVTVSWTAPEFLITKVFGYYIEAWLKNETENEALQFATGGNKMTFKLPAKAEYKVWVRGFNSGGPGKPSVAIEISTKLDEQTYYYGGSIRISTNLLSILSVIFLCLFVLQ